MRRSLGNQFRLFYLTPRWLDCHLPGIRKHAGLPNCLWYPPFTWFCFPPLGGDSPLFLLWKHQVYWPWIEKERLYIRTTSLWNYIRIIGPHDHCTTIYFGRAYEPSSPYFCLAVLRQKGPLCFHHSLTTQYIQPSDPDSNSWLLTDLLHLLWITVCCRLNHESALLDHSLMFNN